VNKCGIIFTIDGALALIFISTLILISNNSNSWSQLNEYQANKMIGDVLITSQILEINNIYEIESNYKSLFGEKPGYIKLNNDIKKMGNANPLKSKLISQRITYINISNKEIYIEIGVYV